MPVVKTGVVHKVTKAAPRKPGARKPVGAPGVSKPSSPSYLTKKQFEKVRPFGDYDRYIKFISRRTGLSEQEVRRFATGVGADTFHKMIEASKDRITKAEQRYIRQIQLGFRKAGRPEMAKYAKWFVVAGRISGYDPRFLAAFAAQESAWGRSTPANAPFNFWGWSVYTGKDSSAVSSPFQRPDTAFKYFGEQLKEKYGGAKSAFDQVWAPYAEDSTHEAQIASIYRNYFGGNPSDIRFRP